MTKAKLKTLQAYQTKLKDRLESPVPEKHKDHPASFFAFLKNELRIVTAALDEAKLEGAK